MSKAILLLATEALCRYVPQTYYFPAYEILMDELRDYRFYCFPFAASSAGAKEFSSGCAGAAADFSPKAPGASSFRSPEEVAPEHLARHAAHLASDLLPMQEEDGSWWDLSLIHIFPERTRL